MVKPAKDERLTFLQSFSCGGIAGVLSRTLTSPLEVLKVSAQVGTKQASCGLIRTFCQIYRNEGIKAFWKGNGISCLRLFPYSAIQIAAFHKLLVVLEDPHMPENLNARSWMIAGSGGTLIAALLVYPADVLKTRLIVQNMKTQPSPYRGIVHAFRTIWKAEGFVALYKGVFPTFLGVIPFGGGTFLAYWFLDSLLGAVKPHDVITPVYMFVSGCVAAAFAKTLSFPFDTIRKKMQAQSRVLPDQGGVDVKFTGMTSAFVQTVKLNGISGLWRGLTANLLKIAPNAGIMYLSFEYSKRFFLFYNGYTESPFSHVPKSHVDQSMSPYEMTHHYPSKHKHHKR